MAGTISSAGIGSGLDVTSLISKLMDVERLPLTALTTKQTTLQTKISTLGTIKSSLSAFGAAAKALSTPAQLAPLKSSVADSTILSAATGTGAMAGTYDIEVQSLASSQKLLSAGYANTTDAIGSVDKKITIAFGTYGAGPTFTANPDKATQSITIDASNNSLAGLRDAINNANIGVSASIINDGSTNGYHLSLTSVDTGARNAMQISVDDTSLDAFTYDPTGGTSIMTQSVVAQDAVIKIDSTTITKQSNTITDALEGITLSLTKESTPGVTTRLSVTPDTSSVQTAIQNFVKTYNDLNSAIADATNYNASTGKSSTLTGDSTLRTIQNQLRNIMSAPIAGAPSGSSTLFDVGVSFQRDGTLAVDSTKLSAALADTSKDLTALFASKGTNKGYGLQLDTLIGKMISPVGILATHVKGFNDSIADIAKQTTTLNTRLDAIEASYRARFSALDTLISSMNATSNYLTQQLTSIASITNGINSGK